MLHEFWVVDYRVYDPKGDGKSKLDHVSDMLRGLIHNFPKDKKVKLFWVTVSANRTEYIVTNDLTQDYNPELHAVCSIRWNIEGFHRELK